jgi:hypothetical protein
VHAGPHHRWAQAPTDTAQHAVRALQLGRRHLQLHEVAAQRAPTRWTERTAGVRRRGCDAGTAPTIRYSVDTSTKSAREQNSGSEHSERAISRILRLRAVVATLAWVASVMELTGLSLYAESCSVLSSGLTVCQCTRYCISMLFLPVPRAQECSTGSYVTMLAMQGRASMRAYPADRWR